jgi:hypothetical protein
LAYPIGRVGVVIANQTFQKISSEPLETLSKVAFLNLSIFFFPEMTVILRDRINDLLTANAELEREVARLRYAPVKVEQPEQHPDSEISLEQTK